ncbi:glyceraldehyde-3-phosphate dehydrogenase-like, partial [Sigmodon hispidus]
PASSLRYNGEGQSKKFSHIESLEFRDPIVYGFGKVKIIAISDLFIALNYFVSMYQYDSTYGKFNGTVKAENRKLVINGKAIITFFQE